MCEMKHPAPTFAARMVALSAGYRWQFMAVRGHLGDTRCDIWRDHRAASPLRGAILHEVAPCRQADR